MVINKDTVWSGVVDIDDTVQIEQGATLTISSGTVVNSGLIEVYGSLIVDGQDDSFITLTDVDINIASNTLGSPASIDIHYAHIIRGSFLNPTQGS